MAGGRHQQRAAPRASPPPAASSSASSSSAPPLPPPLPPPQAPTLDDLVNAPVRIYPMDRSAARGGSAAAAAATPSAALLQCLQAVATPAVVVGVLASDATSPTGVYAFINRLIGRAAFVEHHSVQDSAFGAKSAMKTSIQLFYEPTQSIVFLLGVAKPDAAFLAGLDGGETDADRDFGEELQSFQNEKRKLELLMHACSHLLFQFNERGQFTANILKHVRAVAAEKQSLLALLSSNPSIGKNAKRSDKNASGLSSNVLAPGRCVPLTMFVVPAREDVLNATLKQLPAASAIKSRSSTVAFCKSHEAMLCNLFRSLRGGLVGTLRTRDAVTPANLSKERRLFHVDPAHCVAVLSQTSTSDASRVDRRFESLLSSLSLDMLMGSGENGSAALDLDTVLEPLEDDDVGFPNAIQHLHRGVELIQQNASASSSSTGKDAGAVKMDLLTVAQWLKAFHSVLKTLHRAETKKKQERAAAAAAAGMDAIGGDRDSMRHQFDHMDLRS